MNEITPYKEQRYTKSNFLISSKYASTLLENKITAVSLAKIQKHEYKEDEYGRLVSESTANELRTLLGATKSNSFYEQLEPVAQSMTSRTMGFSDPEKGEFVYISLIDKATYINGVFSVYYNADLKNYIANLSSNFTILELPIMLNFKSVYSFRLYEILSSKAYYPKGVVGEDNVFEIYFGLSELKLLMGVVNAELDSVRRELNGKSAPDYDKAVAKSPERKFESWSEFRRAVIEVAIKEINKKTSMNVSFTPKRKGRGGTTIGVTFIVEIEKENNTPKETQETQSDDKELEVLMEIKVLMPQCSLKELRSICEAGNYDLERITNAVMFMKTQANIINPVGWLIECLKNDYKTFDKPKNGFKNFDERSIDYDELERILLNSSVE